MSQSTRAFMNRARGRAILALTVLLGSPLGLLHAPAWAQRPSVPRPPAGSRPLRSQRQVARPISPATTIPDNTPVRRGLGQHVNVHRAGSDDVVALLHAEVGERRVVILPDGQLEALPTAQAELTSEPFRPATKDEIAAGLEEQGLRDFKVRNTARFVYVYNTSEPFYKGTSRILETMYPAVLAYFKRLKLPVHHPEVPLVAIMFRTEAEFRKFDDVPPGVVAYYNTLTNQVVMYEQSALVEVAPELAMKQSIGTIAHEGIHQILHNIGVQQRLSKWPLWLAEGLAEYFAATTVDQRLRWKGVGTPNDLRMHELAEVLKKKPSTGGEIVDTVVGAQRLTSSGYAAAWSLTHYLASRQKEAFQDYLRDVAQLGPLEPADRQAATLGRQTFTKHFGSDYAALETAMLAHLKSLPYVDPIANQTHYVVMLDTVTTRKVGVTTSPADAQRFQQEALAGLPVSVRSAARFQIVPFANAQLAQQYADTLLGRN